MMSQSKGRPRSEAKEDHLRMHVVHLCAAPLGVLFCSVHTSVVVETFPRPQYLLKC